MPTFDPHDTALSALSGDKMLGVMIDAHIIAQLLDNRYYFELEDQGKCMFLIAVAFIGLALGWIVKGSPAALLNLTVATAILVAIDAACYYFPPDHPSLHAVALCVVPCRRSGRAPAYPNMVGRSPR